MTHDQHANITMRHGTERDGVSLDSLFGPGKKFVLRIDMSRLSATADEIEADKVRADQPAEVEEA